MNPARLIGMLLKGGGPTGNALLLLVAFAVIAALTYLFEWEINTAIVLGLVLLGLILLKAMLARLLAIRNALKVEKQLKAQAKKTAQSDDGDRSAADIVRRKFSDAIHTVKFSLAGRGSQNTLPWYVMLGPPRCGKTTVIARSGLNFPNLGKASAHRDTVATNNLDWWFTDRGILLDTAGRYAVQPSDEDGKEWRLVLDLLRSNRNTDTPLNGVVVAIPVDEVLGLSEDEIEEYAQPLRDRIDEITKRLRIQLPVYVMFTKVDKLNGFTDFFEALTKEERQQIWGATLPYTEDLDRLLREAGARDDDDEDERKSTSQQQVFEQECMRLTERLYARRTEILSGEQGQEAKERVYLFPRQFEIATARFSQLIAALFRLNPFQETLVFRGFYFMSATQKGRPIQQMNQFLSQSMGDPEMSLSLTGQGSEKRPYFLTQFFNRVLFPDHRLARPSTSTLRRRNRIRVATAAASIAAAALLVVGLFVSLHSGQRLLRETRAAVLQASVPLELELVGTQDAPRDALRERLEGLERLRVQIAQGQGSLVQRAWGMDPSPSAYRAARDAYFPYLRETLVEPCAAALEAELAARIASTDYTLDELAKTYAVFEDALMLGNELGLDESSEDRRKLKDNLLNRNRYWYAALGADPDPSLERLAARQLEFVIELVEQIPVRAEARPEDVTAWRDDWRNGWRVQPNLQLFDRARRNLVGGGWLGFRYSQIVDRDDAVVPGSNPTVDRTVMLPEGSEDLLIYEYSFPGMYTQEYYIVHVRNEISKAADDLAEMDRRVRVERDRDQIVEDLLQLYVDDYVQRWSRVPDALRVHAFDDLDDALARLGRLAGSTREPSPLEHFFRTLYRARQLRIGSAEEENPDVRNKPPDSVEDWLPQTLSQLGRLRGLLEDFLDDRPVGERFIAPLAADFQPARDELHGLREAYNEVVNDLRESLDEVNPHMRTDVKRVFEQILRELRLTLRREIAEEAEAYWQAGTRQYWQREFEERFPFYRDADGIVREPAFYDLLGPNGMLFADARLFRAFDVSLDGAPMLELMRDFERALTEATKIRDTFMARGEERIEVPFSLRLIRTRHLVDLIFDAGTISYSLLEGTSTTKRMAWTSPPPRGSAAPYRFRLFARFGVDGAIREWEHFAPDSPFGMLRLLYDADTVAPGDSEMSLRFTWILENVSLPGIPEEPRLIVELTPDTPHNPFEEDFFASLRLPDTVVATVSE